MNDAERGRRLVESGKHKPTVLDEVERFAGRFLVMPTPHCLTAIVLWVAHTWAAPAFYVTPRLVIDSTEPGSGKTRLLEVLALLSRSAKLTLSTTTAALYRRIADAKDHPPTVLQDEADAIFGKTNNPQNEDLRALYNSGYKRGATVDRCETDGKSIRVREFPVFAPVALAGLAGKMPATILDRAVVIHMRRRTAEETVDEFRERDAALQATPIRDRLEAWAQENSAALESCRPTMPAGVRDRPAEVWEALLAIAEVAGGRWPERAREACAHFVLDSDPDALSFGVRLLRDIRDAFGDEDRMFTVDLLAALTKDPESEWSDLWGKPLDQRRIAKELKRYGVTSSVIRTGITQGRGYRIDGPAGLSQAWARYLPTICVRSNRTERITAGESDSDPYRIRTIRTTSVPSETPAELWKHHSATDGTDDTHTDGQHRTKQHDTAEFDPPKGPGRCRECSWHVSTMGHANNCSANPRLKEESA